MKNYRILRVYAASPYQKIFTQFYHDNNLHTSTYEKAAQQLCDSGYVVSGQWSACMRKLGNESIDVIPDFPLLQKKWADENRIPATSKEPLLVKQIEIIK
ncbi:MAG TPA: hypothetical protein VLE96_06230, partial [Chlamydiales bacterium]|nr:hypothetical protein [Chlamydiales bacterium]